ncbi:hypothetical protein AJ80_04881 [Neofusicoccum parvum]|uniref:Uncharacterized protein n=1 Tax=Neofusicoccum parvum TaxID=310453 RepID=A0ACB5S5S0_9PEZI|nr:hypothetical protein AJ80_04881 [Neofusicoccum parvum]
MAQNNGREPIAVVGTACHFPGGSNTPSKLWELLKAPRDLLQPVPDDRFHAAAWHHADAAHHGTSNVTRSYFLDADIRAFDASFFGIPPNECEAIDPQQRLLLETVYEALCAAGLPLDALRGSATACYVGQMCDDWSGVMMRDWDALPQYTATGIARSIMSNRVSYFFDWHGPSMTIDTACSSSLVAVHEAVRFLRRGEGSVAVACGSNLILSPGMYVAESKLRMLSPDGRSRMWDEDANGYARGEGVAVVVLKTLSDALADGDHIECVIRETGFNQDGRTTGITMPSNTAQAALIRETYARAGLDPFEDRPQFFHAHGTGTPAGDPQEAEAISRAFFKPDEESEKLFVGSIKTVIGHTEGTAGLASLIGTALAMQNKTIPPNMHFSKLSPKVAPFYSNLEVPVSAKPWPQPRAGQPLRASVNSFGFGGANAHAILERYDPAIHGGGQRPEVSSEEAAAATPLFTPLTFSAHSQKSLRAMLASFSAHLQQPSADDSLDLRSLAWTLQRRRSALPVRHAVSGKALPDILSSIAAALSQDDALGTQSSSIPTPTPSILGVFTGQGAQWPAMGRALLRASAFVRARVDQLDRALQTLPRAADRPAWRIRDELEKDGGSSRVGEAAFAQPLCAAVQVVLVDLLRGAGVALAAAVGHSSGEIGAAYAAGLVGAGDAVRIAYYRGLYAGMAGSGGGKKGAMMAVGTTLEDARELCALEQFEGRLAVAASNAAASVTLSGDADAVDEAEEVFRDEGKFARRLRVDTAYHSSHMEPCSAPYLAALEACALEASPPTEEPAAATWFSSVVPGKAMTAADLTPQYWVANMRNPVYFSQAVATAVRQAGPFDAAVEVGPHPALKGPCLTNIEDASAGATAAPPLYIGLLNRGACDVASFSSALGALWERFGPSAVDFDAYDRLASGVCAPKRLATGLPPYPWNHDRAHWFESRVSGGYRHRARGPHPLLGAVCESSSAGRVVQWRNVLHQAELPWLAGHRLQGQVVFPAAGYLAMAVEALASVAGGPARLIEVTDFVIGRAMAFFSESAAQEVVVTLRLAARHDDDNGAESVSARFEISSCPQGERTMSLNASGTVSLEVGERGPSLLATARLPEHNMVGVDAERFYRALADLGYHYAPPFRGVSAIRRRADCAVGELTTDARGDGWADSQLLVHPGLLDTCFQTIFAAYSAPGDERLWTLHVPTAIKRLAINPALAAPNPGVEAIWPWQTVVTSGDDVLRADVEVFAADGRDDVLLAVEGISLVPFAPATPADDCRLFSHFVYGLAQPDGPAAGRACGGATDFDVRLALASERFAFYWIRHVLASVTVEQEASALPHHRRMLAWCRFVEAQVRAGEHPHVPAAALQDAREGVEALVAPFGANRPDVDLIRAVGENLPAVVAEQGNIVEHMVRDGMLDAFYERGLGLHIANGWEARMAAQLAHRSPRMRVLEVGGGTGGSTRAILRALGEAFAEYTFTDVSAGFFEAAERRFRDDRIVFKTLDMERDVVEQGFEPGTYDLVLASNVLHVGADLDAVMANIRALVRPGGWLLNMETVTSQPCLRNGFAMAGLPGWWVGAENGRPWGPTVPVEEWDGIYRRTGWSGVDTFPPNFDALHPFTVLATQAVDERVGCLRAPLAAPELAGFEKDDLVIVGGKSEEVMEMADQISSLLAPHFNSVARVESIEAFADGSAQVAPVVLNLAELDVPVMQELFEEGLADRMEALKELFSTARDILWVTKNSRDESPYSRVFVGMARALRKEYPTVNFQALDVDALDAETSPKLFAETLLRHAVLARWSKDGRSEGLSWTREPELYLEQGKLLIPRLRSIADVNDRYNSTKRRITHVVSPKEQAVELVAGVDGTYELREPSPLKPPPAAKSDAVVVHVSTSLLQTVKIAMAGYYFLFAGTTASGAAVLALSATTPASVVAVPREWTIPLPHPQKQPTPALLLSLAAHLLADPITAACPPNGTLLAHDPDPLVAAALAKQAAARKLRVYFTTTSAARKKARAGGQAGWIVVSARAPRRHLRKLLPKHVSLFVDLSGGGGRADEQELVSDIAAQLPGGVLAQRNSPFVGTAVQARAGAGAAELVTKALAAGWAKAKASSSSAGGSVAERVVRLAEVPGSKQTPGELRVVDWEADAVVSAVVRPIDAGGEALFRGDGTYLMVGLSGEVGQSVAQWMVKHGARNVVLTSRNPKVSSEWIDSLDEEYGATVKAMPLDITDREALHTCYNKILRTMPPIAGVAHGAMVLIDSLFQNMDYEDLMTVLRPKILGAVHLDELFADDPLDFFILFSSITGTVGNTGQSNYIGANSFMESLALQRRNRGLAASVLGISSLVGLGYVERADNFDADYFAASGYRNISEADLHALFAEAVVRGRPANPRELSHELITGIVPTYADRDAKAGYLQDVKFSHLALRRPVADARGGGGDDDELAAPVRVRLQSATTVDEAVEVMRESFVARIKRVLRMAAEDEFSATASLVEQGVDSLVAVEVRAWFSKELDVDMPVLKVLGGASVADLLDDAVARLPSDMLPSLGKEKPVGAVASGPAPAAPKPQTFKKPSVEDAQKKAAEAKARAERKAAEEKTRAEERAAAEKKRAADDAIRAIDRSKLRAAKKLDDEAKAYSALVKSEATERMSFGQSRFWFLDQAIKDKTTFNIAISVRLEGRVRVKDMERAVQQVVLRHEALRTRYYAAGEYGEIPMQGVIPTSVVKLKWRQIRDEAEAQKELDELRAHVWDLHKWEGMKVSLLSLSDTIHFLIIGCHHIAMDGVSFQVFYADLEKAYKGQTLSALPASSQYRTFAKLQREAWESGKMDADLNYYRDIIPKDPQPLPLLPFAKTLSRIPLEKYGTHRVDMRIDAALTSKIKAASRKLKSTTFHFYLAALQVLIFRIVRCDDFFIGVADANRTEAKFMGTLGFFLNLLPLRFERNAATNFAEAVQQARNKAYGGLAHSKLPFDILLEKLEIPRSSAHTPLFQVFVDYRQGVQERQRFMGMKAAGENWHLAKTGYDVTLDIIENAAGDARLEFRLQEALYSEQSARLLLQGYAHLLAQLAENPDVDWKTPEVWPREVVERSLSEGRGQTIGYEWAPTVAHRVDEMIAKQPSALALKDGTRVLTYAQMDDRVNAICAALVEAGVAKGDRVGVFQKPTTDWICSLLAIFRAGAVYMPLDTRTPVPRLAAIVADAQPKAILAHDGTWADVDAVGSCTHINISNVAETHAPMPNLATADAPAALLFTSGSTGTPKGIQNRHVNIIKQLEGFSAHSNLPASAGYVLQQSAYSFDKSLEQIFVALVHGGALYVVPAEQRGDPLSITRIMADEGITFTATTPTEYLMWFRYAGENLRRCTRWHRAVLGGEVVPGSLISEFQKLGLPVRLTNSYGPAEITMACTKGDLPYDEMRPGEPIMAGTMLPGYTAYVVDEELKPVPVGCPGEIVISGVGVSIGYLNNEELTSQKYLPCPWQPGSMYRTGDRGRLGVDGVLFCDGRLEGDSQIKLRGVRIELEDIESCIVQTAAGAVTSVVVSKRGEAEDDAEFLAAHVVLAPSADESVLERLRATLPLPQYMIPAVLAPVADLPMTAHFKINRKAAMALPVPERKKTEVDLGALTPTEARLAGLWSELIPGLQSVASSSPFFLSGGNSLMLVKLQAMIRKNLQASLRLIDLMENDTLGQMARVVEEAAGAGSIDWENETALPKLPPSTATVAPKEKDVVVLLTGVTGVLGRNMLAKLAADPRIAKVYAVAVRTPVEGRVTTASDKITVLTGDLAQPLLGLAEADFTTLAAEVDVIFHAGANRSFWDSYYELRATNVHAVKEMVRIAAPRRIPIHFMSSGEVVAYGAGTPPVDGSDGYVSSKWAAERVLQKAAAEAGVEVVLHRPVKSDDAAAAPLEALDELMALARQMGKRPVLDGLSGTLGVVPLSQIVDELAGGLFERSAGVKVVSHGSSVNVDIAVFASAVAKDEDVMGLDGMSALKWTGVAKKMGWSMFMLAQEIFMDKAGERVVSKR